MNIVVLTVVDVITNLDVILESFLENLGMWGALFSCMLITVESMLPVLPLCVFITLLFYYFGHILGFFISWAFTCFGCFLSYTLFKSKVRKWFQKVFIDKKNHPQIEKIVNTFKDISLSNMTLIIALPFTPAFAVNIAAGIANMSKKKFLTSLLIGKLFMVYFWGYIGTTLIESITHPFYLIRIGVLLLGAFIISKVVNNIFKLD